MDVRKRYLWLLTAIVFAICMTVYMLNEFAIHPQSTMAVMGGDAGKNYLSYFYHCMYDKGVWYHGMNYPYGEHIVYSDGQALLTIPISYLNSMFHIRKQTMLAVMNLFMVISYIVAVVYVYKTLLHFRVAPWAAIIFSGLIISLSPQVLRFEFHFALANMCFIPMLFYWFARYHDGGGNKYMLYCFLLGALMSFHHPYFGGLLFVWIAFYLVGYWLLTHGTTQAKLKRSVPPLLCLLGVYAVITVFMKLTDPLHDRPVYPYGALQTVTNLSMITTSKVSPFWQFISGKTGYIPADILNEGYIYIGLAVTGVCIVAFVAGIAKRFKRNKQARPNPQIFPIVWLFVAICTLIFAAGIPFVWNMEGLYEHMSVLRQFRALGRFGWIFYYIITIYAAVMLYHWHVWATERKKTTWAWVLLLLPMLIWARESKAYMKHVRKASDGGYYNFCFLFSISQDDWDSFLAAKHMTGNDFQAVVLLPFIHIGSEKLWLHEMEGWLVSLGAKAALQLHLPIVNVMMSRSSLSQTEKQVRLVSGPYADKPLLRDMNNNKPFLMLQFENDSLDLDHKYLLTASDYLGKFSACNVYVLHPDRLLASDKLHTDSAMSIASGMHTGDSCVYAAGSWYVNHFDTGTAAQKLFGTSAAKPAGGDGKQYVAHIPVHPAYADEWYEYSAWVLVQASDFRNIELSLEIVDNAGRMIKEEHIKGKESTDNYGLWFRASTYFKLPPNAAAVWCRQIANKYPTYFAMDELMLRPANSLIISKSAEGKVMANNHLLGRH